ncbi:MAG: dihydroorotate dehydrogenase electron transfer subunit [Lachnospiraceae bacterium]|nr:dihydroorotate dehydrogenase electron transfer subunit [Lachnospiraceae bacterium]
MGKIKESAQVISQEMIAGEIYSMWIRTDIAKEAIPGQFISVYTKSEARLLPRPVSICEIERDSLRIVYRIAGSGTKEFSGLTAGDYIDILGPLGNGFPITDEDSILIGGGIGIPPMLELAKQIKGNKTIVAGYRNSDIFLNKELEKYGRLVVATDDGSVGTKGNVIDAIREQKVCGKVIYACGPIPMLRGVKAYALETGIEAFISMEERMACGVGACLGCVCKSTGIDDHSKVKNKRICKDGPVFRASEVEL